MSIVSILTVVLLSMYLTPQHVDLDFSQRRHISIARWPEGRLEDFYTPRGKIELTLTLGEDQTYKARVRSVFFKREGELIQSVKAAGHPMTRDEAVRRVQELANEWGFGTDRLAGWERGADGGYLGNYTSCLRAVSPQPEVCIMILPSADLERPWYIMFQVYWPREDERRSALQLPSRLLADDNFDAGVM